MGPIVTGIAEGIAGSGDFLTALARTLSWTPAGAAWSLGGDLAVGSYGAAGLKFLIALGHPRRAGPVLEAPAAAGARDAALCRHLQKEGRRRWASSGCSRRRLPARSRRGP